LQVNPQLPPWHEGWAWLTLVEHGWSHMLQWLAFVIVLTHVEPQSVGVCPEQPVEQAYVPPEPAQTGAVAGQFMLHAPQLAAFETSTSHPWSALVLQ
jgi:hypothetical protein